MTLRRLLPIAVALLPLALPADTISVNFWNNSAGNLDNNNVDPGETAGVVPVDGSFWNQFGLNPGVTTANLVAEPLADDQGNSNVATLDLVLSGAYVGFSGAAGSGAEETGDRDLMNSYISWDPDVGDVGNLQISGLGANFTNPGYDVYVYFETDNNNRVHTVTLNGTDIVGGDFSTYRGYFRDAAFFPNDSNVAIFRGLTAPSLTLDMASSVGRAGVAGVQITSAPTPTPDPTAINLCFHNGSGSVTPMIPTIAPTTQGAEVNTYTEAWQDVFNNGGQTLSFTNLPVAGSNGLDSGATLSVTSGFSNVNGNGWLAQDKDWVMMEAWYGFNLAESLTIANLPATLTGGGYHLIIYGDPSVTRTMHYTVDDGGGPTTRTIESTGVFSGTFTEGSEYVVFTGLSGSSFSILGNDAGTPGRSAINGLRIIAGDPFVPGPLAITNLSPDFGANEITLTWNSEVGEEYDAEGSNTLLPGSWEFVGPRLTATDVTTTITEFDPALATNSIRFYRVTKIGPPPFPPLTNHDFESPLTADGIINGGTTPTGWTMTTTGGGGGIFNPDTTQTHYTNMGDGDPNGGVLPNMDGPSFAYMFTGDGFTGELSQTIGDVLEANTTYKLTVAVGMRNYFNAAQVPGDFRIALETATSGSIVAEFTGDVLNQNTLTPGENATGTITLTESTFTDFAATATTGATPTGLGENLVIRIQALPDGRYLDVDNVRLDTTPAP